LIDRNNMSAAHVFGIALYVCEAEYTFSALRRIKNYLKSTMTERRQESCCFPNVHSAVADKLHVERSMDVLICKAAVHRNTF